MLNGILNTQFSNFYYL